MSIAKSIKQLVLLQIFACTILLPLDAQEQMDLVGVLEYEVKLSDVWGYSDEQGIEYALVGRRDGFSVVSLEDPSAPDELFFYEGAFSTWRDIKTHGHYAYVVNETGGGLLIADLSQLPEAVDTMSFNWDEQLWTAHNVWIDDNGQLYVIGMASRNDSISGDLSGYYIFDLIDPEKPEPIGKFDSLYVHDLYTRGNLAYASHIYEGISSIHDISDPEDIKLLASFSTPSSVTHNAWLNDAGDHLFTTDETKGGSIGSYRINDLGDIALQDDFKFSFISNSTPHNVHVQDDYIVVSHYTDGLVIIDASQPERLTAVGQYDTNPETGPFFKGCWGAYPFLPSGLVLASDIDQKLFVLSANYQRAGFIEGFCREAGTNIPINNAFYRWDESTMNSGYSLFNGYFDTGAPAENGSENLSFSAYGYFDTTINDIQLTSGAILEQDVYLRKKDSVYLVINVRDSINDEGLADCQIVLESAGERRFFQTDANGYLELPAFIAEAFEIHVGKWGHLPQSWSGVLTDTSLNFSLVAGYQDDFFADYGWTKENAEPAGEWFLVDGAPFDYTEEDFTRCSPGSDDDGDIGDGFYISEGSPEEYPNVDLGAYELRSPTFDISRMKNPSLSYLEWACVRNSEVAFYHEVFLSNGLETIKLEETNVELGGQRWNLIEKKICGMERTSEMQLIFKVKKKGYEEFLPTALDQLKIFEGPEKCSITAFEGQWMTIGANPFTTCTQAVLEESISTNENCYLSLSDLQGQVVFSVPTTELGREFVLGQSLLPGMYLLSLNCEGTGKQIKKIVKAD